MPLASSSAFGVAGLASRNEEVARWWTIDERHSVITVIGNGAFLVDFRVLGDKDVFVDVRRSWRGFFYRNYRLTHLDGTRSKGLIVSFPHWLLVILFAAYPMFALIRSPHRRRKRRRKLGLCTACGYDLTGNESGVCPECGKPT